MSFEEIVNRAAKATVIVRATNDPKKESSFTTGFVVGQCRSLCIIMTIGHFLKPGSDALLEVIFFGHPNEVFAATVQLHIPESEILILTVDKPDEIETGKLIFETGELRYLELLVSVSHPLSLRWRAALGIINCPEYFNTNIAEYDSQMIMFDHSLQFAVGSSGAALINEKGNVVGIQSGEISATYLAMSGEPILDALALKRSQTTDLSFEVLALYIAELVYGYRHLQEITTIPCSIKHAVHIKYIDRVLRNLIQESVSIDISKVSLNDLIEHHISAISGIGSLKRNLHLSRASSSQSSSVRTSSQPTCSRTSSQLTCSRTSHAFDPLQGTNLFDVLSRGAAKNNESAFVSEHVREWVNNDVNNPTESFYDSVDGWGDLKGKSTIGQSWRIAAAAAAAAAAQQWNSYGDAWMNKFDSLQSLHGKSVCDGLDVSKGNSRIVESWKIAAAAAYKGDSKEKSSVDKVAWNTFREKAAGGGGAEGHSTSPKFGSNQGRFRRDPYEVLNMSRVASEQGIKAAYRKLAIKYHPNNNGSNPEAPKHFKKVKVFAQPLCLHTFVQCTFNVLQADKVRGATLVVSGDGHSYSKDAIQIIIKMAAANGVRRVWVGQNGLLSTPAVSAVIRERVGADGSKASGAFILTSSRNPCWPNVGIGIKYNMENGGPASEGITNKIYKNTKTIKEYLIAEGLPDVDISVIGVTNFEGPEGQFDVDVFDSTSDYVKLMKSIFDFQSIQKLVASPRFSFCYEALHGVADAYAKRIFVEELGAPESSLLNCVPKEDFCGGRPDPNLTYAKELVARMRLGKSQADHEPPEFGAAGDGDADCNMALGKRFFVTPSDSVAIIAANAIQSIPYFSSGLKGAPRLAWHLVVAKHLNLKFFEAHMRRMEYGLY